MANFVKAETTQTLTWLEFYGTLREAQYNAFKTLELLDGGGEELSLALNAMDADAGADDKENVRIAEAVGTGIAAAGAVCVLIPVVGDILAIVLAACGALITWLAKYFVIKCDQYHCTGYDRKYEYQKKLYRAHQRNLVGVNIPDDWRTARFDCSCDQNYNHCSFIRYMHDGMISDGIEYAVLQTSPTKVGRVRGANAIGSGANEGCVEHWRNKAEAMPLDSKGKPLPKGEQTDPAKAHLNAQGSYYRRAWVVRQVLLWMETHILCRTMNCMEQVLLSASKTDDDSQFNQQRRRGSRWYASIVHMTQDVWQYSQKIGWDKLQQFLTEAGASAEAMAAFNKMKAGKTFAVEETPFEWWPLTRHLSFNQLRAILVKLKPLFPYEPPASPPLPEGRTTRERSTAMKPLMLPIRTGIMYGRDMRPVPAKIGSRGPSTGTMVIGVGAAAVASYAIYRLVSKR